MLEGLEISIKNLSEIRLDNPTSRFDSEFFKKEFLLLYETLRKKQTEKTKTITKWVTQGPNPIFNKEGEIPCLTGRNINKGFVNYNNPDYIDEEEYKKLKRFQLKHGDTLITLKGKGSIGLIGYVTDDRKAIFSRNIGIVRPSNVNSGYLNSYLLSKYGKKLIERGETGGTGQSTLTTEYLKNIEVPRLEIESEIGSLIELSEKKLKKSQQTYSQAENLLLEALGLKDFKPGQEPVNVKRFSESFGSSGRLDAEYYQVKYDDLENKVASYKNGSSTLGKQIEYIKTGEYSDIYVQKSEDSSYYIRNNNISKGEIVPDENYSVFPSKFKCRAEQDEIITSRVGTIGLFGVINHSLVGSIYSDNVLCFKLKESLNPYTYSVLFSSIPYQLLIEKLAGGSVQPLITQTSIKTLIIPIIDIEKQKEIATLVEESFQLKKQSEHLLEVAKSAVEIAIEENEASALDYINQESCKFDL